MKPHLPVRLLRAVVLMMAAAPAALYAEYTAPTEIVVPEGYTESNTPELAAKDTDTAYRLTADATLTPSGASLSGVSYLYTSDSADNLASLSMTEPSGATSVGISVSSQVSFDSLKDVNFTGFTSAGQFGGAAMVNGAGSLNFSNNEGINVSGNSVIHTRMNAGTGGGILVEGTASFKNNGEVIFNGNTAQSQGGAIGLDRKRSATEDTHLVIDGNDTVTFSGNKTNNQLAGLGGALYNILGNIQLNHNGDVEFKSNTARATYMAQGGAIYSTANGGTGLTVELSYNDSVTFEGNVAQSGNYNSTDGNAYGGAILASGTDVILNSNGSLIFKNNKAYTTKTNWVAEGGAIRTGFDGDLSIQNNGTVVFEGNQTQVGSTTKYNSIYADDSSVQYNGTLKTYELDVKISAPEEGSVEFRDCVYIDVSQHEDSSFQLNSTYTGEDGKEIAQTGDIIFTGAYMTSGDKTSEFKGTASLHDGRLVVKEGAVLKADNLVVAESASGESSPTLVVDNATVTTNKLSFGAGTTLESNNGTISSTEGITVNGGTVKGSGTFCALTMNGGELIVGNSPGVQTYEGDVELNDTVVTFSLSDLTTPATEELMGWEAKAYSVIDMNGHNLTIGDGVSFVFEVGGQALAQLIDPNSEESFSFELELFRNVDTLTLDNKTIEELIADSEFVITSDEEGLLDGRYDGWAGMNITEHITSALYTEEDGTVVLNVTMTAVPEPTTATLSLLALAGLAMRRRRK